MIPRKSTSDEVREHKSSLQNVNVTPTQKPSTNHISTPIGNHTNTHTAPRVSTQVAPPAHTQAPSPQPPIQKQATFVPTSTIPPQPAPRKLSQPNGQVRLSDRFLWVSWFTIDFGNVVLI